MALPIAVPKENYEPLDSVYTSDLPRNDWPRVGNILIFRQSTFMNFPLMDFGSITPILLQGSILFPPRWLTLEGNVSKLGEQPTFG